MALKTIPHPVTRCPHCNSNKVIRNNTLPMKEKVVENGKIKYVRVGTYRNFMCRECKTPFKTYQRN